MEHEYEVYNCIKKDGTSFTVEAENIYEAMEQVVRVKGIHPQFIKELKGVKIKKKEKMVGIRTVKEIEDTLIDCQKKRDYWRSELDKVNNTKEEYEGQREQFEDSASAWNERVRTLKYVLGKKEVI
jgi:FtsZ-binding cell division protein ZapB